MAQVELDMAALRERADEMDAIATKEAVEAGGDEFDNVFPPDEDFNDDEVAEDSNTTDEESHDVDGEFEELLRTLYHSEIGEEALSNESAGEEMETDSELEDCAHPITEEEKEMAKCPPGEYLGHTTSFSRFKREKRLRKALCLAKAKGYRRGVDPENSHYLNRGYMTYESRAWPKPHQCRTLPDREWYKQNSKNKRYRPDNAPEHYTKEVCHKYKIEFHKSWKVASTSFPDYLRCQYNCDWQTPPSTKTCHHGYMVVAAVREPIARFVSAANELLERSLNKFCPTGPCGSKDGFVYGHGPGSTYDKFKHQTHWFSVVNPSNGGYRKRKLPKVVKSMVKDTACNYYTYASEHTSTQSNFITQNAGPAAHIHRILKLEAIDYGLDKMREAALPHASKTCKLGHKNVKSCKPNQHRVPSEVAFLKELKKQPALLRELCLVYAQDFVCFDYNLPLACKGMY